MMTVVAQPPEDNKLSEGIPLTEQVLPNSAKQLLDRVLYQAERDEQSLVYCTPCRSEQARKQNGAYFTPVDVARFFWNQYFNAAGIHCADRAVEFVQQHRLIEPSCGSGVLVYSLLAKLLDLGVPVGVMRHLDLHLVDFNSSALEYAKWHFDQINAALGANYFKPKFEHADFLQYAQIKSTRPAIIFGNPPFISNPRGATWKNTYADFVYRCLEFAFPLAAIHFILPLSIAFSRDYKLLREKMRAERYTVFASHFDNIPDALFKSGKPESPNTNKANSQRCTILTAFSSKEYRLYSSRLHRWNNVDRATLLASCPDFYDVSNYQLSDQFIRPASAEIAVYLQGQKFSHLLGDLLDEQGSNRLFVGSVARNYISIRSGACRNAHDFGLRTREDFYRFLSIIASDVFFQYWLTVGDGFHVTRSNILNFPISDSLSLLVDASVPRMRSLWLRRRQFQKTKLNSGTVVHSYDFSAVAPKFQRALPQATYNQMRIGEK